MPKGGKRSGAGRRSSGRTKELHLYVKPETDAKLSAIARSKKVPKGQVVENLVEGIMLQIKVTRTVEFANKEKLNGGNCVFVSPGVYDLELMTLTNPSNPNQSAEFYHLIGTNAVIEKTALENRLAENLNTLQVVYPSPENEDVRTLGELIDCIVDKDASLSIITMPQLAVAIQLACAYFNLKSENLKRFDGKTVAYLNLKDDFDRLQSQKPLPLADLLDVLDSLVQAIRELEEFCGIPFLDK